MFYNWRLSIAGESVEVKASISDMRKMVESMTAEKYQTIYASAYVWRGDFYRNIFIFRLMGFDDHAAAGVTASGMFAKSAISYAQTYGKKDLEKRRAEKAQARTLEYLRRVSAGLPATPPVRH